MVEGSPSADPSRQPFLTRAAAWMRANPLGASSAAIVSVAASVLGLVNGVPAAVHSVREMAGLPPCGSYASVYHQATGQFTRTGPKAWHEVNTASGQFDFEEVRRAPDFILLHNLTQRLDPRWPTMIVRLPSCGGTAQWTYENPEHWTDLFQVWS